jgi:hypothetical protein
MEAGRRYTATVTVRNPGGVTWPARGDGPRHVNRVSISYHWLPGDGGRRLKERETRNLLPRDVPPGESCSVPVQVIAPAGKGSYRLQVTLVQELVAWFEDKGAKTLTIPITVR